MQVLIKKLIEGRRLGPEYILYAIWPRRGEMSADRTSTQYTYVYHMSESKNNLHIDVCLRY